MSDTIGALFPQDVRLSLDTERTLRLNLQGFRYLEARYGSTGAILAVLDALEGGKGRLYTDLPHYIYACLLDRNGTSPLSLNQLDDLIEAGADMAAWRDAASQAVGNFFLPRITAVNPSPASRGPGTGPTGSSAGSVESPEKSSGM